jgi:hypothetical protein
MHGCMRKLDASPRAYTFLWELVAARPYCKSPQAIAVWTLCIATIFFLLRPSYAKAADARALRHVNGQQYRFYLDTGDKSNQPRIMPCTSDDSDSDNEKPPARKRQRRATTNGNTTLPPAHPRHTAAAGNTLHRAMSEWAPVRGPMAPGEPWFCRIEPARQTTRAPKGARPTTCEGQACWLWPGTQLSAEVVKKQMVSFLSPIIGEDRARIRNLCGLRGGGETEHAHRKVEPHVRATIGWWKIRRLQEIGAMVGYEGASVEEMCDATRGLGTRYIRYLSPGVFTTTPPVPRSVRQRRIFPRYKS